MWAFETDGQVTSSPAVWEESVYVGSTDGYVYCLSAKRGELQWKFKTQGPVISPPTIVDGIVYVGSTDHLIYALPV
jgi:outer membrane protein assembly factor BamB